jgi:hypothetical protein
MIKDETFKVLIDHLHSSLKRARTAEEYKCVEDTLKRIIYDCDREQIHVVINYLTGQIYTLMQSQ